MQDRQATAASARTGSRAPHRCVAVAYTLVSVASLSQAMIGKNMDGIAVTVSVTRVMLDGLVLFLLLGRSTALRCSLIYGLANTLLACPALGMLGHRTLWFMAELVAGFLSAVVVYRVLHLLPYIKNLLPQLTVAFFGFLTATFTYNVVTSAIQWDASDYFHWTTFTRSALKGLGLFVVAHALSRWFCGREL